MLWIPGKKIKKKNAHNFSSQVNSLGSSFIGIEPALGSTLRRTLLPIKPHPGALPYTLL
jgi:hypothetical protein